MFKKRIIIYLVVFILVLVGYVFSQLYFTYPVRYSVTKQFEIKSGESLQEISTDLQKQNLLGNQFLFKWYLRNKNLDTKVQIGSFDLQSGLSIKKLSEILTDPNALIIKLTFIEGWTIRDYQNYLEKQGIIKVGSDEFYKLVGYPNRDCQAQHFSTPFDLKIDKIDFIEGKPQCLSLEGYLFPDTYTFKKNVKVEEIVDAMLTNFGKKITRELRAEIVKQHKTIFEILNVASLLEAEANNTTDRQMIADIIMRRINLGMKLQLDSTVNYVLHTKKPSISFSDQNVNSEYNTYKFGGLPLGPINNPGLDSILAAVYPQKNDYLYFLTGKDGKMHYARTLSEHEENKRLYMR